MASTLSRSFVRRGALFALALAVPFLSSAQMLPPRPIVRPMAVEVTGAEARLLAGETRWLHALARFSDGSARDVTELASWTSSDPQVAFVANWPGAKGRLTARAPGSVKVTARYRLASGALAIAVVEVREVGVTPGIASLPVGFQQQFRATAVYSDLAREDVTESAEWASSDPAVALVSQEAGTRGLATALSEGTAAVTASYRGRTGVASLIVKPAVVVRVAVAPGAVSLPRGLTFQLTAAAALSDGSLRDVTQEAEWTSSDGAIVRLEGPGLVCGWNLGTATVRATFQGASGEATVEVTDAVLVRLRIEPPAATIPKGLSQQFVAVGEYTDQSRRDLTATVFWTTDYESVATMADDVPGLARTWGVGTTIVTAVDPETGLEARAELAVVPEVAVSLAVEPVSHSLPKGLCVQYRATAAYTDGSAYDVTQDAVWTSSDAWIAPISNEPGSEGRACGLGTGMVEICAHWAAGPLEACTDLAVTAPRLVELEVVPPDAKIPAGYSQRFEAVGIYTDGAARDLTGLASWTSSDLAVAAVDPGGLARGIRPGRAIICAALETISGCATLTVTAPELVAVFVEPAVQTLPKGLWHQFVAVGAFTDGSLHDLTGACVWTSSDPAVAVVSNGPGEAGQAFALAEGEATICARYDQIYGCAALMVTPPVPVRLDVYPPSSTVLQGESLQLEARALFSDYSVWDATSLAGWSSSDPAVAPVSDAPGTKGLVTGVSLGVATIAASPEGLAAQATVEVVPPQ